MSIIPKITDTQVLLAYQNSQIYREPVDEILMRETGLSEKECYAAMLRCAKKNYVEYGVSLRCGWLTQEGKNALNKSLYKPAPPSIED